MAGAQGSVRSRPVAPVRSPREAAWFAIEFQFSRANGSPSWGGEAAK
jgi:hypothetical protein